MAGPMLPLATRRAICGTNRGVIEITEGDWGFAAVFKADDIRAPGTVTRALGGDHRTIADAFESAFRSADMRPEECVGAKSN